MPRQQRHGDTVRPREELVEAAKEIARKRLTNSTNSDNHYGVGFLGVHDGRGSQLRVLRLLG
jgi:hypothetical protein